MKIDNNYIFKNISTNLKQIRNGKKMSQIDFADLLNISYNYYTKIEAINTKQVMSLSILIDIANKLEIDIVDLIN